MAHDITPNAKHAVVLVKMAFNTTCGDTIADGLNQLLNDEIGEGFLADYAFLHTDTPAIIKASAEPEEGEIFTQHKTYLLDITSQFDSEAIRIETELELDTMDKADLRHALAGSVDIGEWDDVAVLRLDNTQRIFI
jgi:hypothetical protein